MMICSFECAVVYKQKLADKAWKKEKKVRKEKLKTRTDHLNELQVIFNKYIRTRDKGKPCISCNGSNKDTKVNAGHFYSVGGHPNLRFNEDNCHLQCEYCNTYLHGNLIEYTHQLLDRIGGANWLKLSNARHKPLKLTLPEIILLKAEYKQKIKHLLTN